MAITLTEEQVKDRLELFRSRGVAMLTPYKGKSALKHEFLCLNTKCNHQWSTSFCSVSQGSGCTPCAKKRVGKNNGLTQEEFESRLSKINSKNIEMCDTYTNKDVSIRFKCHTCGTVFKNSFGNMVRGQSCPVCSLVTSGESRKIKDDVLNNRIKLINSRGITLISEYTKFTEDHVFKCMVDTCGYEWTATLINIHRGRGCPRCAGKHRTLSEKVIAKHHKIIRSRMRNIKSLNNTRLDKDLQFMEELLTFWLRQLGSIPEKPTNKNVTLHLDHIIPLSRFQPTLEEMKLCWDSRNLQWLSSKENCSKHARIMPEYFTDWHYEVCTKLNIAIK